jgi:undecaprenyl-diphosphatase
MIFLRKEIVAHCTWKNVFLFTLALLPLVPAYFLLKPVRIALSDPSYLGWFLLFTAALLFLASTPKQIAPSKKWKNVIWIGLAQAMALIPGISRSGSTIATARFCGWSFIDGAKFSFLLAIPTIVGGEVLETYKLLTQKTLSIETVPLTSYLVGFCASFAIGCVCVRMVFWMYHKEIIRPFGWYCLGMGIFAIAWLRN